MTQRVQLAIVGAGPAGMAAALEAKRLGLRAVVIDEQSRPGGQIYRRAAVRDPALETALGAEYVHGMALIERFLAAGIDYRPGATLWDLSSTRRLSLVGASGAAELDADQVILATGAMERPVPIPGWTLPGVMGAGAAQIMLKTAGAVPRDPVVLAGSGPLLFLLAAQLLESGAAIRALVETTPAANKFAAAPHLPAALWQRTLLSKGLDLLGRLKRAGVPRFTGAADLAIEGADSCTAIRFRAGGGLQRVETAMVLLHEGVIPHVHASLAIGCAHDWDATQLCWRPRLGAWGETSVEGVAIAGDGGGINGAEAAEHLGRLAALGAAHRLGAIETAARDEAARESRARLRRLAGARRFIDALYRPAAGQRVPKGDATIVCRCEEVPAGEIRRAARLGAIGLTQAKAYTRCGMGACQGRFCAPTVQALIAETRGMDEAAVPPYRPRPPYKPVTLGMIAAFRDPNHHVESAAEHLYRQDVKDEV
jgi:NADPH-dependent 2,4-dienoyl-CoA reductase/sulfur reductase-like enzyme